MSVTGKGTKSIQKKEVAQSRLVNLGFVNTRALHQATLNQTIINLNSLTVPTGVVNYSAPSPSLLASTNILLYQNNIRINSSISGPLMNNVSYVISGASTIKLLYNARENEIFEIIIDQNPRTSTNLADAAPLISTGTLTANTQDYNVGTPYSVGKFLTYQHGSVMVFLDNQLQYRNTGNNPPGSGVTGDYYEVLAGSGLGTIIRFNTIDPINDRNVSVVSVGSLVERPSGSQMAVMEALQGQIDALVPTVAALADVATTTFQGTPNNIDLKAFGDRVLTAEGNISSQGTRITAIEAGPSITVLTTGSGTYTVPAGAKWLRIKMCGGGAGGGAQNNSAQGTAGGNTTFGTSLLVANGGTGGTYLSGTGGTVASSTINSPASGYIIAGGNGSDGVFPGTITGTQFAGGAGGINPFGGSARASAQSGSQGAGVANTGAGGSGGSTLTTNQYAGAGGGAGAYVEAVIASPNLSSSYGYSVGVGGPGGVGGTANGGAGGSGVIIIEAYF